MSTEMRAHQGWEDPPGTASGRGLSSTAGVGVGVGVGRMRREEGGRERSHRECHCHGQRGKKAAYGREVLFTSF